MLTYLVSNSELEKLFYKLAKCFNLLHMAINLNSAKIQMFMRTLARKIIVNFHMMQV